MPATGSPKARRHDRRSCISPEGRPRMTKRRPREPFVDLDGEIWRPIEHFFYEVSNLGRVRSTEASGKGKQLRKQHVKCNGYLEVNLWDWRTHSYRYFLVHRLVLRAFTGRPPPNGVGRHLDGIRQNNAIENLSWGTYRENEADKVRHGTKLVGTRANSAKLTEPQVREIRRRYATRTGHVWGRSSIAREFGVHAETISRVVNGKWWSHVR